MSYEWARFHHCCRNILLDLFSFPTFVFVVRVRNHILSKCFQFHIETKTFLSLGRSFTFLSSSSSLLLLLGANWAIHSQVIWWMSTCFFTHPWFAHCRSLAHILAFPTINHNYCPFTKTNESISLSLLVSGFIRSMSVRATQSTDSQNVSSLKCVVPVSYMTFGSTLFIGPIFQFTICGTHIATANKRAFFSLYHYPLYFNQ